MKEGDIALVELLQADKKKKLRPVLLLRKMQGYDDFLVCGISSQLRQEIKGFDWVIPEGSIDFRQSGLKSGSLVRLGFLAVVPEQSIPGGIGNVSQERLNALREKLADYIRKPIR
jgi:mRNA interferase MazF